MRRAPLLVLLLAGACSGDPAPAASPRADQVRTAAEDAGLAEDVVDLLATAAGADAETYRLDFEVDDGAGGTDRVEYRQRPPQRRLDVFSSDGTATSTIADGTTVWACDLLTEWTCVVDADERSQSPAVLDPSVVTVLTDALVAGKDDYDFVVEDRDLLGVGARCLVTRLRPASEGTPGLASEGELCIAPTGAILLAVTADGTIRATDYSDDVEPDAFELPADLSG